jgi:pimeloyl-ACP methyl ester carboxylesterase
MAFVTVEDGTRIHYKAAGRPGAPPLLMIQGLGADHHGWDMQRFALAPLFKVITPDNRGVGRSSRPTGPFTLEEMADDAIAVLDKEGHDSAHVVGASMGGAIAQILAVKYPHRIRSLTLACTSSTNPQWRRELLDKWSYIASTRGMAALGREAGRWVIGPRSFRRMWPAMGWLGPFAMGRPGTDFQAQVDAILSSVEELEHMHDKLAAIEVPALVIVGNQDILTPRGDSELLREMIPTAEMVVISGAAHGFMVEHASTFNKELISFLRRAERVHRRRTSVAA